MNRMTTALTTGAVTVALLAAAGVHAQDDSDTSSYGPETFAVDEFDVDGFAGTIEVIVEDRGDIQISATGPSERMERFEVDELGDRVEISYEEQRFRWDDWSTWLSWWSDTDFSPENYPFVTVRLPAGTPVDVDGMTGNFTAGDLMSALDFGGAGAVDARVGDVLSVDFGIAGAADVTVGHVSGRADISISGAGDFEVASSGDASVSLHGAGDVTFGEIRGGLDITVAGMGDVDAVSVNGPVDISLAGAGSVTIDEGRAERFDVSIAGAGNVHFGGTAVDPDISIAGAGDVYIESYEGRMSHSGMGDVTIGGGS